MTRNDGTLAIRAKFEGRGGKCGVSLLSCHELVDTLPPEAIYSMVDQCRCRSNLEIRKIRYFL